MENERIESLEKEVAHWKKVAAGLKGHNAVLSRRVEHYKALDLEGDELNEKRIAEIEKLKKDLIEKRARVSMLESLNEKLKKERDAYLYDLRVERENFEAYRNWPWYKKIFSRW